MNNLFQSTRSKNLFYITLICVFGIIAFTWSRGNTLVVFSVDVSFPPDRLGDFYRSIYTWDHLSLGGANFRVIGSSVPLGMFLLVTEFLGVSLVLAQKIWIYLLFTGMGLSMYFLTITVIKEPIRYAAGFCAALVFMFNPWNAIVQAMVWQYVVFLPIILALYIKGLNENKGFPYIFGVSLLWTITCSSGLINIRAVLHQWLFLFFYLAFFLGLKRSLRFTKSAVSFTLALGVVWTLVNAYWVLPLVLNCFESIESAADTYKSINFSWMDAYRLNSARLVEAIRLMGYWAAKHSNKGVPYIYWTKIFFSPLFVFIGFSLAAFAFLPFLLKRKLKQVGHATVFFGLLSLFGLFVMNGHFDGLGKINYFAIKNIRFFVELFSLPYFFGGIFVSISYAVLIGMAIGWFVCVDRDVQVSKVRPIFGMCFLALFVGLYGWPVWSGEFVYPGNEIMGSARYRFPAYYSHARNWLREQPEDFRLFPIPYSKLGYMSFTWPPGGYQGPDPTTHLLARDVVTGNNIGSRLAQDWQSLNWENRFKVLGLLNVKYILKHRDANWKFIHQNNWYVSSRAEGIMDTIGEWGAENRLKQFGELVFYQVPDIYFVPHISTETNAVIIPSGLNLIDVLKVYHSNHAVFLPEDELLRYPELMVELTNGKGEESKVQQETFPEITFQRINPTKYHIRIRNASGPFWLVFAEQFQKNWGLYSAEVLTLDPSVRHVYPRLDISEGTHTMTFSPFDFVRMLKPPLQIPHVRVNGYANAWYIDPGKSFQNSDGDFVLYFNPQSQYYLGLFISFATLITAMVLVSVTMFKKKLGLRK